MQKVLFFCRNKQGKRFILPDFYLYPSQNSFRRKSKNNFARVKSSAFSSPGKVLGVFQSGDNCNQDLFSEKTKNQIDFSIIDWEFILCAIILPLVYCFPFLAYSLLISLRKQPHYGSILRCKIFPCYLLYFSCSCMSVFFQILIKSQRITSSCQTEP